MKFSGNTLASFGFVVGTLMLGLAPALCAARSVQTTTPTDQMVIESPAQKAQLMGAFVYQDPDTVAKVEALERDLAANQLAGDSAKMLDTARRILALAPNNLRALEVITLMDRASATGGDAAALKESCTYSQAGLKLLADWKKEEGLSDADFEKMRNQMMDIFNGAAGFCALQAKTYPQARDFYIKAFQIDPTNVQDVYQLSIAELEMTPIDVNGFWYCGKTIALLQKQNNPAGVQSASAYCKAKYKRFHGSDDGWDPLVALAATQTAPPANFAASVKPAPTPCDLAVQAVQENDPATLSFSDKEFILEHRDCSPEGGVAAQKVWASIQTMQKNGEARLKIPGKVISATAETIMVAITDDNQQANKADMQVKLTTPMPNPPAAGAMINVIGVITRYTLNPFLFVMEKGEVAQ